MEQLNNYLQQLQPVHDSTEEISNKFLAFRQHFDTALFKYNNTVEEKILEARMDVKGIEDLLLHQIQDTIRFEVNMMTIK